MAAVLCADVFGIYVLVLHVLCIKDIAFLGPGRVMFIMHAVDVLAAVTALWRVRLHSRE